MTFKNLGWLLLACVLFLLGLRSFGFLDWNISNREFTESFSTVWGDPSEEFDFERSAVVEIGAAPLDPSRVEAPFGTVAAERDRFVVQVPITHFEVTGSAGWPLYKCVRYRGVAQLGWTSVGSLDGAPNFSISRRDPAYPLSGAWFFDGEAKAIGSISATTFRDSLLERFREKLREDLTERLAELSPVVSSD